MMVDYDVTVLVTATPPRHTTAKQVITAVTGRVNVPEIADLDLAATLSNYDGTDETRIFTTPSGDVFVHVGSASPEVFTDRAGGLEFLRKHRVEVSNRLRQMPKSAQRFQFHPGSKIVSADDFGRVDPWESGATQLQMNVIDKARQRVEDHLSSYVVMGDDLYRRSLEPFLVLSVGSGVASFRLDIETDVRENIASGKDRGFEPIACFALDQAKAARAHAASLVEGVRPRVKGGGIKVSEVAASKLHVDALAMTLRAAAVKMLKNYVAEAVDMWDVEGALSELPMDGIIAFRKLSDAVSKSWNDIDMIDAAVNACLEYEAHTEDDAFTGRARVSEMIEAWNDRPIGLGLSGNGFAARA
ncbi:hypothetical protein [Rhizobium sp. BK176]|uniref:hypothetical protein n=1 Tax=Rhizobium sp. BK176 TaxID=2587071 RepID=UPI002169B658|nr:hypothetical protein [Rhizobium sp. BK176]MCS4088900.1 hypothetical protein [Rhizobium sp. BK176]